MKIKQVKFYQAVRFAGGNHTSINLDNQADAKKFDLNFEGGLLTIKSLDKKEFKDDLCHVGMSNVQFMVEDLKKVKAKK